MNKTVSRACMALALLVTPIALTAPTPQGKVIEITSVDQYNKLAVSGKPMVAMYTAAWCGPCKATKPEFIKVANAMPNVHFCFVDIDKQALKQITAGIRGVPTFKFIYNGEPKSSTSGGRTRSQLEKLVNNFVKTCPTTAPKKG